MYNVSEIKTTDELRRVFSLASGGEAVAVASPGVVVLSQKDYRQLKSNAAAAALAQAQLAFAGAAEDFGVASDEDVQKLVDAVRYGADK